MASTDVKLLGMWASPYVVRAKLALKIKGVAYEYQEEALDNKSELFLKSNPINQKVPVLIHKDKPVCESTIIVQYIDEVFDGPSILPSDPFERAQAKFWAYFIDDMFLACFVSIVARNITDEGKVQAVEKTIAALKSLEDYLAEKPFFGGDSIGYVDITLGPLLCWFKIMEEVDGVKLLDEEKLPNLVKWAERFSADGILQDEEAEYGKLAEYKKAQLEKRRQSKPAN